MCAVAGWTLIKDGLRGRQSPGGFFVAVIASTSQKHQCSLAKSSFSVSFVCWAHSCKQSPTFSVWMPCCCRPARLANLRLQQQLQLGSDRGFAHEVLTAIEEQERIARQALQLQQNTDTTEQQAPAAAAAAAARANVPRASRPVVLLPGETMEQRRSRLDARNERDRSRRADKSTAERQASDATRNEGDRRHRARRSTAERDLDNAARAAQAANRTDEQRAGHAAFQANARRQQAQQP